MEHKHHSHTTTSHDTPVVDIHQGHVTDKQQCHVTDRYKCNVADTDRSNTFVELKPFANQVGGHTCVLEIDDQTICKPYVEREVWFYQNVPGVLKEFTPQYYGDVDVTYDVTKGNRRLVACIPTHLVRERSLLCNSESNSEVVMKPSSKRGRKRSHVFLEKTNQKSESCYYNNDKDDTYNQWSMKCLERQITRYGFWANNQPQKFIMLGNLVSDYKYPCMMDLKMGRRQYGDDSSEEKRKLLEKRCAKSTSSTLGFRICGTQVYQDESASYVTHDKYHGRYLDKGGVCNEIKLFFTNRVHPRKDVISLIIEKLKELRKILLTEKKLNLYSCSLLVIYDGFIPRDQPEVTKESTQQETSQGIAMKDSLGDHLVTSTYDDVCSDNGIAGEVQTNERLNELSQDTCNDISIPDTILDQHTRKSRLCRPSQRKTTESDNVHAQDTGSDISEHVTRFNRLRRDSITSSSSQTITNESVTVVSHDTGTDVPNPKAQLGIQKPESCVKSQNRFNYKPKFDVRLIDFAHVSEKKVDLENDEGEESSIVFGLTKLVEVLNEILLKS